MRFEKHVFICTNERPPGGKKSCGEACGLEMVKEFKRLLKEKNLQDKVRAQKTGCLDACEYGPALVVYPEGVFYGGLTVHDLPEIVDEHIVHNRPVQKHIIDFTVKSDGGNS